MLKTSLKRLITVLFISFIILSLSVNKSTATDIDIMFVYDNGAASWANSNGGITAFNQDVINRMNQVMQNSGIDATFRLVHSMTVNTTETNLENALTALQAGSGVYSTVLTARNTYGADLVAMFIDTGSAYGYVGRGYMLSTWAGSPNYAFTTNAIRSVAISHTLTHEIGHNLGAHHSKYQTPDPGPNTYLTSPTAPYSAGWYFTGSNGTKYHTIMAYNDDGYGNYYTSAPLFSTPLVTYQGSTAGHAQDGDNARLIRATKDIVANYRQGSSSCTYSINPTTASFQANGGTWQVAVTASSSSCSWSATSNVSWITINSGSSGTGSGTVYYTVSANTSTSTRTGTITIAGQTHTVTQAGSSASCTYSINPTTASFQANGGTWQVAVTASSSSCSWTATSNVSWITINSGSSGTGSGTVYYTVSANTSTSTRTGTITIAGQTHTVTQAGSSASCTYTINPTSAFFQANGGTWQIAVTASSSSCSWTATSNVSWITINSGSSGTGSGTVYYTVSANTSTSTRTGTITIAGQTHTVTQAGSSTGCAVSISPMSAQFSMNSGTGTINVTASSSSISEENRDSKDELLMSQYFSDTPPISDKFNQYSSLMQKAETKGRARIIIKLKERFIPEGLMANEVQASEQRSAIAMAQTSLLESLQGYNIEGVKRFEYIPYMALETDASGLSAIYSSPNVEGVYEDKLEKLSLSQSVPLIQGDQAWNAGYTGSGWTVAILDTGVQSSHPFLSGKVVSEACYSTNSPYYSISSLCPNGQSEQVGTGAGLNCSSSISSSCGHGTHVAGITAGTSSSFSGVAKNSNIIAIQVFSRVDDYTECDGEPPCLLSYPSDQIKGMERVYALRNTYNISSVNMSIGGDKSTGYCDSNQSARKAAIDNLRSVGIATVIASGNSGYTDGIAYPACISTAISVGSTTKSDAVSSFSNSASILRLLAPGSYINSSLPTNSYASWSGTSMAAPHVAGAWALMKHKKPTATVTEVLQAFQNTGTSITDSRNGIVKPRINVKSALDTLSSGSCTWTATSNASWITINSGSSGTGSGTVNYTVSANSGSYRTGTITIGNQIHTVTQSDTVFADVNSSMWSKNYIVAIYNNGITIGCIQSPIRYYCPSSTTSRGEMAVFIIRAKYGNTFFYPTTPYFSDVPPGHPYFSFIQRLKYDGITSLSGTFRVNDPVLRGEMAAFIIRARYGDTFFYPTTPYFSDVPSSNTYFKYVQRLKYDNTTTQTGIYRVNDAVSREEMAAFLSRAFLGMQ